MKLNVTAIKTGDRSITSVTAALFHAVMPKRSRVRCITAPVAMATARVPPRVTVKENPNSLIRAAPK